ncbi:hypothetical protein GH714_000848 [Hevea brasiliensis]|uniref:Reverse transcriptase/retrotransposon-derived protein RNase H-like domain-containing protein n=1 Tax=Hevea brasiliensis TaxID=3981 RepID=A0A6A6KJ84_HEVBR|nr:hypothetical protein GH714_000848 [Hevea brasiliensis]
MAPITNCFKKGEFNWAKVATRAFDEIKLKISEAVVLGHPNFDKVFEVAWEVSGVGIGGVLSQEEFIYNNSVNHSTDKSSFKIVHGYSPHILVDLVSFLPHIHISQLAEFFAQYIHDLHVEIRRNIALSNENYKLITDVHRRNKEFNIGDYVTVCIPRKSLKKLHA